MMVEVMWERDVNVFGRLIIENVYDLSMTREGGVSRRAGGPAERRAARRAGQSGLYRRMRRCGVKSGALAQARRLRRIIQATQRRVGRAKARFVDARPARIGDRMRDQW
ncbi:hypothetical protein [Burkholderia pseudomultivorans]|uniref:hypothetical protein n=1 Tax=Burkholderia pseudomultivorans TaxID=1207504 RepID=UPI00158DE406|nr:hypothetical protein [Burkholderia pseudomultivorans]